MVHNVAACVSKSRPNEQIKGVEKEHVSLLYSLFTPDTILRWHRKLIAMKWDYSSRRSAVGRPAASAEVVQLILKMAAENSNWGYDRIAGALANLGHKVSDQTVGNVLKKHGIEPAPDRTSGTSCQTFLKAHWDTLATLRSGAKRISYRQLTVCHGVENSPSQFCGLHESGGWWPIGQADGQKLDRLRRRLSARHNALDHGS